MARLMVSEPVVLRLAPHIVFRFDDTRQRWIMMAPERLMLPDEQAVEILKLVDGKASVGVIVNELITNACKYAYAPGQDGEIRVRLAREGDRAVRLTVEDDGRGLDGAAHPEGTGLGARLIVAMAKSLRSKIEYDPHHAGVRASMLVPL